MKKWKIALVILVIVGICVWGIQTQEKVKETTKTIINTLSTHSLEEMPWEDIETKAKTIPPIYPFSLIRSSFLEIVSVGYERQSFSKYKGLLYENKIPIFYINAWIESIKRIETSIRVIEKNIQSIPRILLTDSLIQDREKTLIFISKIREGVSILKNANDIIEESQANNERILVLLQNTNEPRSTGGFAGSFILIDTSEEFVEWKFLDMYAYDRRVKEENMMPAPEFFHDLSQTISLRDANFFPHFPTSAKAYQIFFKNIGEKKPTSIFAVNQNIVFEILKNTEAIVIDPWNIEVTKDNYDLVLQFLLGSKIMGRFNVKTPVLMIGKEVGKKITENVKDHVLGIDTHEIYEKKYVLGYSENTTIQKKIEEWGLSGYLKQNKESDNFLYFDFISVGANKSEKFMWSKIEHNSLVQKNGTVINTLKIKRTHALQKNEIENLLKTHTWSPNIQALLTPDLKWILGAGENRSIIRVYAPKDARLKSKRSPSGEINQTRSHEGDFTVFEVPLFIAPGESGEAILEYETQTKNGNYDFRPYFLELIGTPGKEKTNFLSIISTEAGGTFTAQTQNIGLPTPLSDQNYRVLIEYK